MKPPGIGWGRLLFIGLFVLLVGGAVAVALFGTNTITSFFRKDQVNDPARKETKSAAELVRDENGKLVEPPTIRLTSRVAESLGINKDTMVAAASPQDARPLPPQMGTLAFDNDRLFAVRSRFPGEVSEILDVPPAQRGSIPLKPNLRFPPLSAEIPTAPKNGSRSYTVGDKVKKGDLLAIVWSKDLGDKKAALIDAMIDLRRDTARLKDLDKLYEEGSVSANTYFEAQRTVQKDRNARNAAERTLRMWKLDDAEIDSIKKEAESIDEAKRDPKKEKDWARVEVRAYSDGIIVEKNTHLGDWVDPANFATPMFRVADLSKLQVWINPAEEYLPVLQDFLKKPTSAPLAWDIILQADPSAPPLKADLLRIAPSLDYTQHTPLVVGLVENPTGKLLIGQFVTVTLKVRLEEDLVEIPTAALNEEKGQSVVFVQQGYRKDLRSRDSEKFEFTMRPVSIVHRFKDFVYVRSKVTEEQAKLTPGTLPVQALEPGERVITESIVEVTKALRDLRAKEELTKQK